MTPPATLPRLSRIALLAVGLCTSVSASAADEPTPTQIREAADAFDRGREAYKNENWAAAADQFELADHRAGSATALEYAIRSRDKAGQLDRAANLAVLVEKRYPDQSALVKVANDVLARAKEELFEVAVSCSEPCDLAVAGKILPGPPDLQRTIFLTPGRQTVRAGFGVDRADSQRVDAQAGGRGQLMFDAPAPTGPTEEELARDPEPEPKAAPEQPKQEPGSGWSPAVFWVGVGLTAALAGATIWSGVDTLNNPGKLRLKNECDAGDTSCPTYREALAHQTRTNVLIGATAGAGVATVLIGALATNWSGVSAAKEPEPSEDYDFSVTSRRRTPRQQARIVPWVVLGREALLGAQGRF